MRELQIVHIDLGGCDGCVFSVVRAVPQLERFGRVLSPYISEEPFEVPSADVTVITGSVCLEDTHRVALLEDLRKKSKLVIAFGSCAAFGGITRYARGGQRPKPEHRSFRAVSAVINVDYAIPGCPPPPATLATVVRYIAEGRRDRLLLFEAVSKVGKLSGFDLLDDVVLPGLCIGCGACTLSCPTGALFLIESEGRRFPELVVEKCIRCGTCYVRCPRASQILVRRYLESQRRG